MKTPPDSILSDLTYDPGMGEFRWVVTPQGRASNLAGSKTAGGYTQICYKRVLYYAHRLAFLFMTGSMPEDQVDHANGDRSDNRWGNLRVCSKFENAQNARPPRHRTNSLPVGVKRNSKNRFWAEIMHKRVVYPLGNFRSPDEAHAAYLRAKASLHYFQPVPREGLHG